MKTLSVLSCGLLFLVAAGIKADQLEMQNGDRFTGKVVSMTPDTIVLQSEVLGKITVPRSKVANINLAAAAVAPVSPLPTAPAGPDLSGALRGMGANTNFIEQVRKQFLGAAGPEANTKFDELVAGLFAGKFDLTKLRAEAKTAADQIRELKRDQGSLGEPLNSYLAVLEKFLKESVTTPTSSPVTGNPASAPSTNASSGITIIH